MSNYCGLDVSNKSTNICVIDSSGSVLYEEEVGTESLELEQALKGFKGLRCVVESSPLAESICSIVESAGHKIEILDARHAKAVTQTKKKTDRVDALKLAQVCRTGWYTRVHRKSGRARHLRSFLTSREQLKKIERSTYSAIRGILRAHGIIVPPRGGDNFEEVVHELLSGSESMLKQSILPLLKVWREVRTKQKAMYMKLDKEIASKDKEARLLSSIPSVGCATASAFIATIDDPKRFSDGEKVASYLGLVPSLYQSGDTEYRGRITKQGDRLVRSLLVEAANNLLSVSKQKCALREWGLKLIESKGNGKARVAVARKLAVLMHKVWVSQQPFVAEKCVA